MIVQYEDNYAAIIWKLGVIRQKLTQTGKI